MSALTEALVAAQKELPTAIGRDSQGYGYRYTSLDKLIAETRPILTKHGLTISQWPSHQTVYGGDAAPATLRPMLTTRIDHVTGENNYDHLEYHMPLILEDGHKTMQGLGAAITYARRYAWAAALGIASEEDTDAATLKADEDAIPF